VVRGGGAVVKGKRWEEEGSILNFRLNTSKRELDLSLLAIPSSNSIYIQTLILVLSFNSNTSLIWYLFQFNAKASNINIQTQP
jgi:hypothetical protein